MSICSVAGCNSKHYANGMCKSHYHKAMYRGEISPTYERHGMSHTGIYSTWEGICGRCNNPSNAAYKYYGGRGIRVCERWSSSFVAFYKDVGDKPFVGAELDRIDSDGNYCPENVQWVTKTENLRKSNKCKLNMNIADKIREMHSTGEYSYNDLAKMFNVSKRTIGNVVNGNRWSRELI